MRNALRFILIAMLAFSLSGCATVITGWNQKVPVTTDPSGAFVQVDGKDTYTTPAKIRLKRNCDHELVITKEGYTTQTVKLIHMISGAFCGNVFLFGPVGMGLDAMSGAQFKLEPEKVHVELKKE